jgi:hypothetical protein
MSDVLAIAGRIEQDDELVEEVARRRPSEVTIVIGEDAATATGWAFDETPNGHARRDRLARLLSLVELRTGASVMGAVGDLRPLRGRWFDNIVDPALPGAALS